MALTTEGMEGGFEDRHPGLYRGEFQRQTQRQDRLIELHETYALKDITNVSDSVRNDVLELLRAIEYDEVTFDDTQLRSDTIKQLWGKVAHLNVRLKLKHPETAYRYGTLGHPEEEVRNVLNIKKA